MDEITKSCTNCGASLKFQPGTLALKCMHCGTENEIPQAVVPLAVEPEYIVPLAVDEKVLKRTAQTFMSTGKLTPDDLLDTAKFTKLDLFYVPAYLYRGSYEATWTASFGYDRQEHYTDYENKWDSNLKMNVRTAVAKTKTVTDWRPMNGADMGNFVLSAYAGTKQPPAVAALIEGMSWSDAKSFDTSFLVGFRAEEVEKSDSDVYSESVDSRVNVVIDNGVRSHAQGDRQRDWNWKANISKTATSYFLPIGWVKYEYGGREYNLWVDGIDPSNNVGDELPVDSKRKSALIFGYTPAAAGALAFVMTSGAGSEFAGWMTLFGLGYGGLRHWSILNFSKKRRESTLARKLAEEGAEANFSDADRERLSTAYSDFKPGFLASTARDKVLLPAMAFGIFALSFVPGVYSSLSEWISSEPAPQVVVAPTFTGSNASPKEDSQTPPSEAAPPAEPPETRSYQPQVSAAPATPTSEVQQAPRAFILEKGSPDRKMILDTVRPMVERLLNPPVTFQVETIRIAGDYAYLRMTPIRPTGDSIDTSQTNLTNKNVGVLTQIVLKRDGGTWKLQDGSIGTNAKWGLQFCNNYPRGLFDACL
jgi:hypothetical protein